MMLRKLKFDVRVLTVLMKACKTTRNVELAEHWIRKVFDNTCACMRCLFVLRVRVYVCACMYARVCMICAYGANESVHDSQFRLANIGLGMR